jgi:5,5'-dehydrodivanillate O-demethylase oxygenase subunit
MLSREENETLTQVAAGTPGGDLWRRYWHPIAAATELDARPTKAIRLLGEDLVLYKDKSGTYGLIDRRCAHRRVDLATCSVVEEHGLRCGYHGWCFNKKGECIEQPYEQTVNPNSLFKKSIKMNGYPVQELGGLLFAYLGPGEPPLVPRWKPFVDPNAVRDVSMIIVPCNWLQIAENSVDLVHLEWLHYYFYRNVTETRGEGALPSWFQKGVKHLKVVYEPHEYGIVKRRLLEGMPEDADDWKTGSPYIFPNLMYTGSQYRHVLQYRVPVDQKSTLHITYYAYYPPEGRKAPAQPNVPFRYTPLTDERGEPIVNNTFNQDYLACGSQGEVCDRSEEHLGMSDSGVIMLRRMLREQMEKVARGEEPMNTFRDPVKNEVLEPPCERVRFGGKRPLDPSTMDFGTSRDEALIREVIASWE